MLSGLCTVLLRYVIRFVYGISKVCYPAYIRYYHSMLSGLYTEFLKVCRPGCIRCDDDVLSGLYTELLRYVIRVIYGSMTVCYPGYICYYYGLLSGTNTVLGTGTRRRGGG